MIQRMDDFLVHQTALPLAQVASQLPAWEEGFYFFLHDREGRVLILTGCAAHPNTGMVQGILLAICDGVHYRYIHQGPLLDDWRENIAAGSLSFRILEPTRRWGLVLEDKDNDIRAEVEFQGLWPMHELRPVHLGPDSDPIARQIHLTQGGVYRGTLRVGDTEFTDLVGTRTRNWGHRLFTRMPFYSWFSMDFPDLWVNAWLMESDTGATVYVDGVVGRADGTNTRIERIEHEVALWPGTNRPRTHWFTVHTGEGRPLRIHARETGSLFFGPPEPRWSLSDKEALARADSVAVVMDQYCEFTFNHRRTYGVVEVLVAPGCRRYGIAPRPFEMLYRLAE